MWVAVAFGTVLSAKAVCGENGQVGIVDTSTTKVPGR
jgi:hypothetical protein